MKSRYNCVTEIQGRLAFPHVSKNRFQRCCGGPLLGIRGMLWFLALSAEKSWLPPWGSLLGLEVDIILLQLWFLFWTDTPPPPSQSCPRMFVLSWKIFFFVYILAFAGLDPDCELGHHCDEIWFYLSLICWNWPGFQAAVPKARYLATSSLWYSQSRKVMRCAHVPGN